MGIDLFRRGALVEGNEPLQQVVASGVVVITASVVGEVIPQR
jgi:anaerobic glycerol-3-phosphate dehydrogenase